jgi:hypothetical protein
MAAGSVGYRPRSTGSRGGLLARTSVALSRWPRVHTSPRPFAIRLAEARGDPAGPSALNPQRRRPARLTKRQAPMITKRARGKRVTSALTDFGVDVEATGHNNHLHGTGSPCGVPLLPNGNHVSCCSGFADCGHLSAIHEDPCRLSPAGIVTYEGRLSCLRTGIAWWHLESLTSAS